MKTSLLCFVILFLSFSPTFSQYCGHLGNPSGPSQCSPTGTFTQPGLHPSASNLPSLINGAVSTTVIEFQNFDTIRFGGQLLTVQSVHIDSIGNLPNGLCWATDTASNTFLNQEPGCIRINGIACSPPGQYRLKMIFTMCVGPSFGTCVPIQMDGAAAGLYYYLRVKTNGLADIALDTSGQSANTNNFLPYSMIQDCTPNGSMVLLTGKMFYDANQNQILDAGEQPVRNQRVNVGTGHTALTNYTGEYYVYSDTGTYTIKPVLTGGLSTFAFSPDSLIVNADSGGVTYGNNNFGVIIPANYCEGHLSVITNNPPPRPGFNNNVTVNFVNAFSANPVTQTVQLSYDADQRYVISSPVPATVDTVNRLITWNIMNLNSGATWQAVVTFNTGQTVALRTILNYLAVVSTSTCAALPAPMSDEEVTVVGSYDPNDKAVSPVGVEPGGRVLTSTEKLSYTIRFQNTGTYLAENVNVVDTISPLLDISTLQVQAASHNYEVLINGREVTFRFSQIMLPDSNANEPMSHGYIKYSIQPTAGFVQGSVIHNRADIYFDFNSAIRTNTTQTTADNFIGITKSQADNFGFEVYPNPLSTGSWTLTSDAELIGKEMKIFDAAGRNVYSTLITKRQTQIDASGFQQGVYLLRIEGSSVRIIKL
jgi:hypothetical protein